MPENERAFIPLGPQRYVVPHYQEGDEVPPQPQERIAYALEYIAEAMDNIGRKLDTIIAELGAQRSGH